MLILVCGSRGWTNRALIREELEHYPDATVLHGGARGADRLAGAVAAELGLDVEVMLADWVQYGRSAGYRRNVAMLDRSPDLVLAFWDGESKGTAHTIREAKARGIETRVITKEVL